MIKICSKNGEEYEDDKKRSTMCPACRSKTGRQAKRKGSSNERRLAKKMSAYFQKAKLPYICRRTPASGAIRELEVADLIFSGLPIESIFRTLHFEAKDTAQWSIKEWVRDAEKKESGRGMGRSPLIIMRHPNEQEEYAVMKVDDLLEILVQFERLITDNNG